jgi:hypothetical protein
MAVKKIAYERKEERPAPGEGERQGGHEVPEFIYQVKGLDAATLAQKIKEKLERQNVSSPSAPSS